MKNGVVKLFDEMVLLDQLTKDTFSLIAKAATIAPVKKLIEIHDILNTNASLLQRFKSSNLTFDEVWLDTATIKHLNHLRCCLMVYHHTDFTCPIQELRTYNKSFSQFLNLVVLRVKNGFGELDTPKINF